MVAFGAFCNIWGISVYRYDTDFSVKNQKESVTYRYIGIGMDQSQRIGIGLESLHTDTNISV